MNNNTGQSPKQSEFAAIGKALAEIIEKNKKPATLKAKPHETILDEFLNEIESIDFREILGLESQDKIQQKQLIVLTIDEILSLIRKNDFGLCSKDGFVYLFNGAFWKPIDREEFRSFLGKAAARLGVNELEAKHFAFRDNLYKQFNAVADAPKLKESEGVLVNLQNGTLEVSETEFLPREHRREDFLTYQLEFAFNDKAERKLFDAYLERVLPDRELQFILAEFIAYCFTRHLKLERCLFLYGTGANGKSVFFDVISALLGSANITSFSLDNLNEEHNRALINNKLLNYSSELGKRTIDSDLFKKLVSGEAVQCRLKYGNPFFSRRYAKLLFRSF
jgi:putative DNA primase/helicase